MYVTSHACYKLYNDCTIIYDSKQCSLFVLHDSEPGAPTGGGSRGRYCLLYGSYTNYFYAIEKKYWGIKSIKCLFINSEAHASKLL